MKVYIGVPMYGAAEPEFYSALSVTKEVFKAAGWTVEVDIHAGCSIITKARNEIVARFLESGFDKLLFIDSDMVWDAVDAYHVVISEHGFCGIGYTQKSEEKRFNSVLNGEKNGAWIGADRTGTGFIALSRAALVKMSDLSTEYSDNGKKHRLVFDFALIDGEYWGEDYNFCRRWKAHGGKIWLYPGRIGHIGKKIYWGNIAEEADVC